MRRIRNWSSSSSGSKKWEYSRVYKRRAKNEKHETRICDLPKHILHHIFSFLDIKQAIQTCILSRRWRYFWVSIPTLNFNCILGNGYLKIRNKDDFIDFVDRVLMFRGNSNMQRFVLDSNEYINVKNHLNTWILVSVLHNVQELILNSLFPEKFQFHHCLFTSKSLTQLVVTAKRHGVSLSLPASISLPTLRTLSLASVIFQDEYVMDQLFSSCPILESLTLKHCEFPPTNVNISSPQLQHLVLEHNEHSVAMEDLFYLDSLDIKFKLCAPNLISFRYACNILNSCALKNLSSLVKADIGVLVHPKLLKKEKARYDQRLQNILRELHNVEDLKLSASSLEVITRASDLLDSQPTKFCNLRCLRLRYTWCSVGCFHAMSYLLKISPNIETLFVVVDLTTLYSYDKVDDGALDLLEVQPTQFCNLRYLNMDTWLSRDCVYTIAYFLKIFPKIETLSLVSNSSYELHPHRDEITSNLAKRGDYWKVGLSLQSLLNHLKYFELRDVGGHISEFEFLEILLKNAMLLGKLFIIFYETYSVDVDVDVDGDIYQETQLIKFKEKVLTFCLNKMCLFKYCNLV